MTCGIYYILNIETKKVYIGSSIDIEKRIIGHKRGLLREKHHNIYLQRAWLKHGSSSFEFGILELIPKEDLLKVEQTYIDLNENGYNLAPAAGGDILSNHPNRENIFERIKNAVIERTSKMTSEEKKKIFGKPGESNPNFKNGGISIKFCPECEKNKIDFNDKTCHECRDRTGEKNPFYGKQHSLETKQHLSNIHKNRCNNMTIQERMDHPQIRFVEIEGIIYSGVSVAARCLNVTAGTICFRIKSVKEQYNEYKYVDSEYVQQNMDKIKL